MSADEPTPAEEQYSSMFAARDEARMFGETAELGGVPDELRQRLDQDLACAQLLRQALRPIADAGDTFMTGSDAARAARLPLPWKSLGRFELRKELGRGGFGIVYLAFDPLLNREVALKVPRAEVAVTPELRQRFRNEARAAAGLEHPNLVPVYEAAEVGPVCFIVSAYCPGISLSDWLKQRREPVTFSDAANLIATLAEAVQHAHNRGVVHRDLKPANVLLVSAGVVGGEWSADATYHSPLTTHQPRITDFGLAKFFGEGSGDGPTRTGVIMGTPSYMSPEQAAGKTGAIGPATDVYALGAILYELLTGRPPIEGATELEIVQNIQEREPVPPRRLRLELPRDLDTICLKCLQKEPGRRYDSAAELAGDLRRFLRGEPIHARPQTQGERLWRWCRRNPLVASLAAAIVLLLLSGTVISNLLATWAIGEKDRAEGEQQAAQRERDAASAARDLAEERNVVAKKAKETAEARQSETDAMLDFVIKRILSAARPENQEGGLGYDVKLRDAVQAALPFVAQSFSGQPLIEARLRGTLGITFYSLGDAKTALEQYQAARTLFSQHLGPDHPNTLLIMTNVANCYAALGQHADALKLREETLALQKATFGPDHHNTLTAMNNLAISYEAFDRGAESLKLREETLALRRAKLGPDHPDTLGTMVNVGYSYAGQGRHTEAVKQYEDALIILKSKFPDHRFTFNCMHNLANSYVSLGRHVDALELREATLALRRAKLGPDHPDTLKSMHSLANSYATVKGHAEALKLKDKTLALRKKKLGPDHPDTLLSMWNVVESLMPLDRGAEAVPIIDQCLQRAQGKVVHRQLITSLIDLRLQHFAKSQDAAGCRMTAEMWEKLNRTDPVSLYSAACIRAVTAAVIRGPGLKSAPQAEEEADRAMAWLKQAVAVGFKDVKRVSNDTSLDALRAREDFQNLIKELAEKPRAKKP